MIIIKEIGKDYYKFKAVETLEFDNYIIRICFLMLTLDAIKFALFHDTSVKMAAFTSNKSYLMVGVI